MTNFNQILSNFNSKPLAHKLLSIAMVFCSIIFVLGFFIAVLPSASIINIVGSLVIVVVTVYFTIKDLTEKHTA